MLEDDDWIQRGAGPDAENYSSWTIGKKVWELFLIPIR